MEREFSHAVVFPSANPDRGAACAARWKKKGYTPIVMLDDFSISIPDAIMFQTPVRPFPGYYRIINHIVVYALDKLDLDLVTCIGDDMDPPDDGAQEIARMYFDRFPMGEGILQGCGDPQGKDDRGIPAAARICGSPTFGNDWLMKAYGGKGAFHSGYSSFYSDEDMWNVAHNAGLLWLNPEINIYHKHWSWGHTVREDYHRQAQKNWQDDKALFERRKAEGFPEKIE